MVVYVRCRSCPAAWRSFGQDVESNQLLTAVRLKSEHEQAFPDHDVLVTEEVVTTDDPKPWNGPWEDVPR